MRKVMYLMGSLEDTDIEWLGSNGTKLHLKPNQVLVREGQPVESLFVVMDGQLACRSGAAPPAALMSGEVVGEISFIDSLPSPVTVTAVDAARVLAVRRDVLQSKLAGDTRFASNFYRALAIFLADRLRAAATQPGYGGRAPSAVPAAPEELGDNLMDTVSHGTRRFDNLLRRIRSGG
jgi:CRP-like cAMP-binding protein